MKHYLLLFSMFFLSYGCYAQPKTVRQYYYWTNQAELAICDSNFQRASDCYEKAFGYHAPFAVDMAFAYRVNSEYIYDEERLCKCFAYAAQMGEPVEWYVEDSISEAVLYKRLKYIEDTTICMVMPELSKTYEQMLQTDQDVRMAQYPSEEIRGKTIDSTDKRNLHILKKLYRRFPVINDYTLGMSSSCVNTILIHNCRRILLDPRKILHKEVLTGNVRVGHYKQLEDYCKGDLISSVKGRQNYTVYGTNPSMVSRINNTLFIITPSNIRKVNRNRKKIGDAETWNDYVKKIKYIYTHESPIRFYPTSTIVCDNPEEREAALRKAIDEGMVKGEYLILNK